jgi:hypothetical protein
LVTVSTVVLASDWFWRARIQIKKQPCSMLQDAVNFCSCSWYMIYFSFNIMAWRRYAIVHFGLCIWCYLRCYLLICQGHLMRYGVFHEDVGDQQYSIWHSWSMI